MHFSSNINYKTDNKNGKGSIKERKFNERDKEKEKKNKKIFGWSEENQQQHTNLVFT